MAKIQWINSYRESLLPGPVVYENSQPSQTPGRFGVDTEPSRVSRPKLLAWSVDVAEMVGLSKDVVSEESRADVFSGNMLLSGAQPIATRYGGHQFGNWAGQLGDGRAILLGEIEKIPDSASTESVRKRFEIQLKGAGSTVYSRRADGRAVLRSSLREFLCSEAMHYLGVPTTRCLALVKTGDEVLRDILYQGRPEWEPGAVVTRVAPSFLRFGHFEILAAEGDKNGLKKLFTYTIENFFPTVHSLQGDQQLEAFFNTVCLTTAAMIAKWQSFGFIHGVMNTDNMSILGLTIDYGPFGWLEDFQPNFTPNTTDWPNGRYSYNNQPAIGSWNLMALGRSLESLGLTRLQVENGLNLYKGELKREFVESMQHKMGLSPLQGQDRSETIFYILEVLEKFAVDWTLFFYGLRELASIPHGDRNHPSELTRIFAKALYDESKVVEFTNSLKPWLASNPEWSSELGDSQVARLHEMEKRNPCFILRNYLCYQATEDIEKRGDVTRFNQLFSALQNPFTPEGIPEEFMQRRPEWARDKVGCAALSCSS